jgi:hypothetical protein
MAAVESSVSINYSILQLAQHICVIVIAAHWTACSILLYTRVEVRVSYVSHLFKVPAMLSRSAQPQTANMSQNQILQLLMIPSETCHGLASQFFGLLPRVSIAS